jgi:hypothetical protein
MQKLKVVCSALLVQLILYNKLRFLYYFSRHYMVSNYIFFYNLIIKFI